MHREAGVQTQEDRTASGVTALKLLNNRLIVKVYGLLFEASRHEKRDER
jgi:hypothetical protein